MVVWCILLFLILSLLWSSLVASRDDSDSYQYDRLDYRRTPLHEDHVHYPNESRITFLYIIGLEGSGHHLLRPLLQHLSWITGHRPLYGSTTQFHNELWFNRYLNQSQELRNFFLDKVLHRKEHVAVIEFASFPFENNCRSCSSGEPERPPWLCCHSAAHRATSHALWGGGRHPC